MSPPVQAPSGPPATRASHEGLEVEWVLGCLRGARPGPTLVCIGGIHGNEPAGVQALRRVLARYVVRGPAQGTQG